MVNVAHYIGRPDPLPWQRDARIYRLEPGMLTAHNAHLVRINTLVVSGIREATTMVLDGKPVFRLHTVAYAGNQEIAVSDAWVYGQVDHDAALWQIGYIAEGKP